MEIIKKVSIVKSLVQFTLSKPWKSFIDNSQFIKVYGARHTQPRSLILSYKVHLADVTQHICIVDDNIETLQVQEFAPSVVVSPLLKQYNVSAIVGTCHGLLCLYCYNKKMLIVWNPFIRKSFGINVPRYGPQIGIEFAHGFGVCPVTSDPTAVKIIQMHNKPWHVEVFTLSSGIWNVIPSGNLPRRLIKLNKSNQVVIDRFVYWAAYDTTFADGVPEYMVVSFNLINKEFKVTDLPDSLTNELFDCCSVYKLRESRVVYGLVERGCDVWVMEHDASFRKLFTIDALVEKKILGFKKNGETIFETSKKGRLTTLDVYEPRFTTLDVYNPCSQQIKNLGIS